MKFVVFALSALAGLALAQSSGSSFESTAPTSTAPLTPQQSCVNACAAGDVNCWAVCVGFPRPGTVQVNAATDCVAKCDQGDGSAAASQAYAKCRDACISSYIITSGTAAPGGAYTTAILLGVSTTPTTPILSATPGSSPSYGVSSSSSSTTTSTSTDPSTPTPTSSSHGGGGLSQSDKITLGVGIPSGIFALISAWVAWHQCCRGRNR
jgi:hypothetical protein